MFAAGNPVNVEASGMINTFIAPVELSWKFGDSGFYVKTGLGMYVPDGTVTGVNGLGNLGNPWWTFMPEFVVSYLKDGWNLTANVFEEINTRSTVTQYRSGDILHPGGGAVASARRLDHKVLHGSPALHRALRNVDGCLVCNKCELQPRPE